ncbi:DNA-directed RNA polymerase II subunit [Ceratobasidium sp. 395]|nr:DNA-directed RNA polymerase II subunit [Ceratobasidium sp. 395]
MTQYLESKLYSDVEGTCSGRFGYIIAVLGIVDVGKGMVMSGTGQAEFVTKYRAIVFKPFKGEVVDGVVTNVNKIIDKNTHVRLKIVGTRVDATEIFAIGTIKEDSLGVID